MCSPPWWMVTLPLSFRLVRTGNLVYLAGHLDFEIYVRRIEGGREINITNDPAQDIQPEFSPDASSIAFVSTRSSRTGMVRIAPNIGFEPLTYGGDIWVAPALGGPADALHRMETLPCGHPTGRSSPT